MKHNQLEVMLHMQSELTATCGVQTCCAQEAIHTYTIIAQTKIDHDHQQKK